MDVWLRTCEEEVLEPIEGEITGTIPSWLHGTFLRNGPGANRIGETRLQHVFDGPSLLHRFHIKDGQVTYNCRFLQSNSYKRNRAANRLVLAEFGTKASPDPHQTFFERFHNLFNINHVTDNASISVYPIGDGVYALHEAPNGYFHRIDPVTLETLEKKGLIHNVLHQTAHPHISNGDVYNAGLYLIDGKVQHAIVKYPHTVKGDMFKSAKIVGTFLPRWRFHPTYMHSFGITDNYFVFIDHPMCLSLFRSFYSKLTNDMHRSMIKCYPEYETHIVLVHRNSGEVKRYPTDTIFFMHIINSYELDGRLILDFCSYKDMKFIDFMSVEVLEKFLSNAESVSWLHTRPKRIEIPLDVPELTKVESKELVDIGCDFPIINYQKYNGKPYKYFYGIILETDPIHPGAIVKVNSCSNNVTIWHEPSVYAGEPAFVARPDAKEEDDGVLLSVLLDGKHASSAQLLILDAKSLTEMARVCFKTPSPVPRGFHGWFFPNDPTLYM